MPSQPPPNPIRRPASSAPPPLPAQGATPLAPWSPPVQGRPVTLPAFDAALAPPPAQAKPAAAPTTPSAALENPFTKPATPLDRPAAQNPFVQSKSVSERPTLPSPAEPSPIPAAPPALHVNFVEPSPVPAPVHASPVAEPVPALASPPPQIEPELARPVEPIRAEPVLAEPVRAEAPAKLDPPFVEPAPLAAAVLEMPFVDTAKAEPRVEANAFETAPTEFASSETPITSSDAGTSAEPNHAIAEASAEPAATESPVAQMAPLVPVAENPASAPEGESVVAEAEIQEQAVLAQPFPAPRPFTSSGSEMPVVITTPPPPRTASVAATSKLLDLGREVLPRAGAWTRKKLRSSPRALVIGAPLVALLGIWAVRGLVTHSKPAQVSEVSSNVVADVAAATPAAPVASAAEPAAPILVSTSTAPAVAPPSADASELSSAIGHGLPALEALAQKFPKDPQVALALASQQAQAQRFEAAVESIERAIALDAKSAQNGKVMGILWRAAQSGASEASFLALRKLGARGSDIAFDLATTAGVREAVRERAKGELDKSLSPEASEDTRVASALLLAPACDARKALLSRAEREGGKRTQTMLEQYSRGTACASSSDQACNACLTGSPELAHALARLSAGGRK